MPATLLASLSHQQLSSNPYKSVPRGPNFSRTSLAANANSPASIPTTHKVLLQPVIKSKGFNGSSERFVPDKSAEGPGPALYNWTKGGGFRPKQASPNSSHLGRNSNSGKKDVSGTRDEVPHSHSGIIVPTGSGNISVQNGYLMSAASLLPFAGKKKRNYGLLTGNTGPGPGSYDLPGAFITQTKITKVPPKPLSGNIKTVRSHSQGVIRVQEDEVIGPGRYDVRIQSKNTNSGVAMLSKVERFDWVKRNEENLQFSATTGLSQANLGLGGPAIGSPTLQKQTMNHTSSFAVPIKETLKKVRLEDFDRVKKLLEIEAGSKDKPQLWNEKPIPGPGSYNTPDSLYWTMNKPTNKKGGTVSFLTKNDRAAAFQSSSPSAPYYDIKSDFDVKKYPGIGMSSMFRSSTKRDQAQRKMIDRFAPVDLGFSAEKHAKNKNPNHLWI